ncbi:MAG TPA: polyprenyl diphosphate synthase [Candidatus Paceibacterota bacterium]|nr:polyprenyl diphosphate synthase [Candidatus Paceibacterota bacterium]
MTKLMDLPLVHLFAPKTASRTPALAPACVGIILDGNRRWAKKRGLPSLAGHTAGMRKLKEAVRFIADRGVRHLIVYGFSTENWNRPAEEVSYLMELFRSAIASEMEELAKEGVRIRFVGERERFSPELKSAMDRLEKATEDNTRLTLWCCLSYGGRAEIAAAAAAAAKEGAITEQTIASHLWTAGMPDPDIIIRTGGEQRVSNFLPWQSTYSEFFFVDPYWPDFSEALFDSVLSEYAVRERRHGK